MILLSVVSCCTLLAYVAWAWRSEDRAAFLPGETTHGHHQIELACQRCHTPFEGVREDACNECHAEELELADDSHPASKFTDPRNADRVAQLDARSCMTCHTEHRPARTGAMGLTLPDDYCFRCHQDVAEERPTHEGLAFDSCQSAGCHNFHDNRALHEDFLEQHLDEPPQLPAARLALVLSARPQGSGEAPLSRAAHDAPPAFADAAAVDEWASSAHARGAVNCSGCHIAREAEGGAWVARPGVAACRECHRKPVDGFLAGKHGMRLAAELEPMRPELARQPMRSDAHGRELGCNSCHPAHAHERGAAAVDACLGCHADEHSLAYEASPHGQLWRAERALSAVEGSGVSCATCHMPRVARDESDRTRFSVQHNQNDNLRPNEKMVRSVCQQCHGIGFVLDALADRELVARNFSGRPGVKVKSMQMVRDKLAAVETSRAP